MHCFNHQDKDAIGICKSCNKALCAECSADTGSGIACKGKCEQEVKNINELVEFSKSRAKLLKISGRFGQVFVFITIFAAIITIVLKKYSNDRNSNSSDSYVSQQSLYNETELGIKNTFGMDTTLLTTRKIYFNYDFNEYTCGWLIKLLWLLDSKNNTPIDLYINSSGGYITETKAIGNTIRSLKSKVNTFATGYCASSALRAVSYGTGKRAAFCNTILLFHGNEYNEIKKENSYDAAAVEVETKDWKSMAKVSEQMVTDTTEFNMTPQKALELGFIDTVICSY